MFEGVYTIHELRAALLAEGIPETDITNYLREGIAELCAQGLITWVYEPDYGNRQPVQPSDYGEASFRKHWTKCFGSGGPGDGVPDAKSPTLFLSTTPQLATELDNPQYGRYSE